jgi:SAM-dependent methyltransferase
VAGVPYDAEHIARFYDEYGEREWTRFDATQMDRVGLEVHMRFLREFIGPEMRVLEVGAGPGRFTLELARLGASIAVGDISPRQLELHAEKTSAIDASIESRELLDVVDLGRFGDESFDAAVCFGGPVSYVLGEADRAVSELLRVTRVGGCLLVSVMSLLGAARAFHQYLPGLVERFGWERAVTQIFETGDLDAELNDGHVCRLYRWRDLEALLGRHPWRLLVASAANFLAVNTDDTWDDRLLDIEVAACREPGALDGGTHILAAVERI